MKRGLGSVVSSLALGGLVALAVTGGVAASSGSPAQPPNRAALPDKPVLPYLWAHAGLADQPAIRRWSAVEHRRTSDRLGALDRTLEALRRESDAHLRRSGRDAPVDATSLVAQFNADVRHIVDQAGATLRNELGEARWRELTTAAVSRWETERRRRSERRPERLGPYLTYTVFCTQYDAETPWEVAVPDKLVKFANRDWSYEPGYPDAYYAVRLTREATVVEDVPVWDVGPWNVDDNYWNAAGGAPRPRRLYVDLPRGRPEAEAAFFDDYNGGLDQFGRVVLNPGGCDLSFDVAAAVGLEFLENDWIQLEYKWEAIPAEEFIYDNPVVDRLSGRWQVGTSAPDRYGPDYYWTSTGTPDARLCLWKLELAEAGTYDIAFWWPEGSNRTPDGELGAKQDELMLFSADQQTGGGQWNSVGAFTFDPGTLRVGLRNGGPPGWVIVCDAIRLTRLD